MNKNQVARKYRDEHGMEMPTLALARVMYKENNLLFSSVEDARRALRVIEGKNGARSKAEISDPEMTKYFMDEQRPKNPYNLPDSDETKYEPYILKGYKRVAIFSDIHIPYHSISAITIALDFCKKEKPDCLLLNGDILDAFQLSKFGKDPRKRSFAQELETMKQLISVFQETLKCKIIFKKGNHCFDSKTELLTINGWKKHNEIDVNTLFATYNKEKDKIEYVLPEQIHINRFDGEMRKIKNVHTDLLVTDNHRLLYKFNGHTSQANPWHIKELSSIESSKNRVTFRCSSSEGNEEYKLVSDDEIRLVAWLITDGSIEKRHENFFYYKVWQRKSKVGIITGILNNLGIEYNYRERDRDIKQVQGIKLKKKCEISCEVAIKAKHHARLKELIQEKYVFPEWLHLLSDRQFDVFLSSFIDGDGSRHKGSPTTSLMAYGMLDVLEQLQVLCCKHNYRTTISEYRTDDFRLNIFKGNFTCFDGFNKFITKEHYSGIVWCITNSNDTVIARRNGKISITGNSERYEQFLFQKAAELVGIEEFELDNIIKARVKDVDVVGDKRIIHANKLNIIHGHEFSSGFFSPVNVARGLALRAKASAIQGHNHQSSEHTQVDINGKVMTTFSTGCLCELHPQYAPINNWNWGFAVVDLDENGEDFEVRNKRIYKGKIL